MWGEAGLSLGLSGPRAAKGRTERADARSRTHGSVSYTHNTARLVPTR